MSGSFIRKIPWRRKWQPTPVFLPGKSNGQRRMMGYSPWGCKEWDTTEHIQTHRQFQSLKKLDSLFIICLILESSYSLCMSFFISIKGKQGSERECPGAFQNCNMPDIL